MFDYDILNYLKHQYEENPIISNKINYANYLGNSENNFDVLEAIRLFLDIQEEELGDFNYKIGLLYRKLGNIEKAFEFFDKSKDKTEGKINFEKGKAYLWNKEYSKALEMFDMVDDIALNSDIIIQKIKCYIALKDDEKLNEILSEVETYDKVKDICYKLVGTYYYDIHNDVKAYQCFSSISDKNLDYITLYKLGNMNVKKGNYDEALSYYLKAYKFDKKNKTYFLDYKIGLCYENLEEYDKAIRHYKKSAKESDDNFSYLKIGKLEQKRYEKYNNLDHLNSAKYYLTKGVNIYSNDIFLKYELLKVQISLGNINKAFSLAMEILEIKDDRPTLVQLTRIYLLQGKFEADIELCKKLLEQVDDRFVRLNLVKCYIEKRMYDEALCEVNKVLANDNKDSYALLEKARIYFRMKNYEKTKELLNQVPDDQSIILMCEKMNLLSNCGDFEKAYEVLSDKLEERPNDPRLNITMSNILENNNFINLAIEYNLRAIKESCLNNYIRHLAELYFINEEYDLAIKYYSEYMQNSSSYADGALGLINVYMVTKDYEKAYNLAYQLLNTYKCDQALAVMAEIELLMGHRDIAKKYFNEIVSENTNREDSAYVKRLKSLIYE